MKILEIAELKDGEPKLVARLYEDGKIEGTGTWKNILKNRVELGIERLAQRLDNGYVMTRIVESDDDSN